MRTIDRNGAPGALKVHPSPRKRGGILRRGRSLYLHRVTATRCVDARALHCHIASQVATAHGESLPPKRNGPTRRGSPAVGKHAVRHHQRGRRPRNEHAASVAAVPPRESQPLDPHAGVVADMEVPARPPAVDDSRSCPFSSEKSDVLRQRNPARRAAPISPRFKNHRVPRRRRSDFIRPRIGQGNLDLGGSCERQHQRQEQKGSPPLYSL
mmetsp:Transcript_58029/g.136848  ORF Transcript_58029/g.136848 Transcript_58029/m.136848 type:complete len:211 (-) Transcript_58029:219-851(-)